MLGVSLCVLYCEPSPRLTSPTDQWTPIQRSAFYVVQIPVLIGLYKLANGIHRLVRGRPDVRNEARHVERAEEKVGAKKGQ